MLWPTKYIPVFVFFIWKPKETHIRIVARVVAANCRTEVPPRRVGRRSSIIQLIIPHVGWRYGYRISIIGGTETSYLYLASLVWITRAFLSGVLSSILSGVLSGVLSSVSVLLFIVCTLALCRLLFSCFCSVSVCRTCTHSAFYKYCKGCVPFFHFWSLTGKYPAMTAETLAGLGRLALFAVGCIPMGDVTVTAIDDDVAEPEAETVAVVSLGLGLGLGLVHL